MRNAIIAMSVLAACGGGSDDEIKVEPSGPPPEWIKICNGGWFCTLTWGGCAPSDGTCTVCDPNKPLSQC